MMELIDASIFTKENLSNFYCSLILTDEKIYQIIVTQYINLDWDYLELYKKQIGNY